MVRGLLRGRLLLEEYLWIVVGVFAVLALAGGFVTYDTYVEPGVEVETETVSSWSDTGSYTHSATVVTDTDVFERGEILRDRAAYFQQVTPILDGTLVYQYEATDGGDLQVETTQTLVLRSIEETDEETIEFWRQEEELGGAVEESVGPADPVEIPFSLNVTEAANRVEEIESQLGGTPGETEILVRSEVSLTGTRNGREVDETRVYEATVSTGGNVYSVENTGPETDSGEQVRQVEVQRTYGPLRTIGAPLLLGLSVLAIGGVAVARHRDLIAVSGAEREWLAYESTREEFDDWITRGHVPEAALSRTRVPIETLEGLVDVAIDSDRRVVEDPDRGLLVVLVGDVVYTFDPPAEPDTEGVLAHEEETTGERKQETAGDPLDAVEATGDTDDTGRGEE